MSDMAKLASTFTNSRPTWKADELATACARCSKAFNVIRRKHHCRNCGEVVCGACSSKSICIPKLNYRYEVRVCDECFALVSRPI